MGNGFIILSVFKKSQKFGKKEFMKLKNNNKDIRKSEKLITEKNKKLLKK